MDPAQTLQHLSETLGNSATVKSVFGDPISIEGKTVVPIARVAYGFGAGGGKGPSRRGEATTATEKAEGGGGGGGMHATPAGALEITATGTRFVPFTDLRWLALAFAAGAVCGGFWLRKR
jgi:uncharacterized spore protein YtfJ